MVALYHAGPLDFADTLPQAARQEIRELLAVDPRATREVYAALARKVWALLVEHRFDSELREWHDLLHRVRARVRSADGAAAERITALADLLRESISLAKTSPARSMAARPRARRILERLNSARNFVARQALKDELAIGSSNLSNILTQLVAHNLVVRRDKGKEAEFRITEFGRQVLLGESATTHDHRALVERAIEIMASAQARRLEANAMKAPANVHQEDNLWIFPSFIEARDERIGLDFGPDHRRQDRVIASAFVQPNVAVSWAMSRYALTDR